MILHGHTLDVLRTLADASVQCVVTSPPYWALRRYDIPDVIFDGAIGCEHEWGPSQRAPWAGGVPGPGGLSKNTRAGHWKEKETGPFCQRCGGWRGQMGQEPTPGLFVAHMVSVFREVRRVLRLDGTCWLNMGDCYANSDKGGYQSERTGADSIQASNLASDRIGAPNRQPQAGLKNKDLVGIPWMLAFALREDGWYLRAESIWAKGISFCETYAGSVMPESIKDRPTRAHEQVFLLTKSERYFYDHEAVKEIGVYPAGTVAAKGSGTRQGNRRGSDKQAGHGRRHAGFNERYSGRDVSHQKMAGRQDGNHPWDGYAVYDGTRNLRSVWAIGVEPFHEAHFATFPPDLVAPCLKAGTSAKGACATCGAPWRRVVEYEPIPADVTEQFEAARQSTAENHGRDDGFTTRRPNFQRKRLGERWDPTCACDGGMVPCAVLDPFAGSGTVGVVCERMSLRFVGVELGEGYVSMAERRIGDVAPLFSEVSA